MDEQSTRRSHIMKYFDPILLKMLFAHALLIDMEDNNEKVDVIRQLLPENFIELAPGTNRYVVKGPDGFCYKIALDRRGIVDNVTEFKRSPAIQEWSPLVYECNGIITVTENVELITKEEFILNRDNILYICGELAQHFIFEDIGFAGKNFCNWGIRHKSGDLVILDTGYMIPIIGNEEAMTCPVCGAKLKYNATYTGFRCSDTSCNTDFRFIDVYRRLDQSVDNDIFNSLTGFELPDFDALNDRMYNATFMKGGHIYYDTEEDDDDDLTTRIGGSVSLEQLLGVTDD